MTWPLPEIDLPLWLIWTLSLAVGSSTAWLLGAVADRWNRSIT